jgi:hypothetical protein
MTNTIVYFGIMYMMLSDLGVHLVPLSKTLQQDSAMIGVAVAAGIIFVRHRPRRL